MLIIQINRLDYFKVNFLNIINNSEELLPDKALIVFGLMTHEEKISVMNLVLEKQPSCQVPIQTHDALVFQVGYRRFEAAALFSQHNNGNKFKVKFFAVEQVERF